MMLKTSENDTPTLADALEKNEIEVCEYHDAARLQELNDAIKEAWDTIMNPDPEPEPDPNPNPNPNPNPDPQPGPGPEPQP